MDIGSYGIFEVQHQPQQTATSATSATFWMGLPAFVRGYGGQVGLSLPPRPPKMTFERLHGYNPMFTRFFEFCDRLQLRFVTGRRQRFGSMFARVVTV